MAESEITAGIPPDLQTVGEHYRLTEKLGEGAFGEVYRAHHGLLDEEFAVKVLRPELCENEDTRERFLDEARALIRFSHVNVVQLRHVGEHKGRLYLVMDFVRGRPLDEVLRDEGAFSEARALRIMQQVLAGLEAAHAAGIIHRDLKPSNLILETREDGSEHVRVLDFGLSKLHSVDGMESARRSMTGTIIGTLAYMSPEQLTGSKDIDQRSDVFAAGLLLQEMLQGEHPYPGDSGIVVAAKLLRDPLPDLRPDVNASASTRAALATAVERDRDARYGSVAMFSEALAGKGPPSDTSRITTVQEAQRELARREQRTQAQPPHAKKRWGPVLALLLLGAGAAAAWQAGWFDNAPEDVRDTSTQKTAIAKAAPTPDPAPKPEPTAEPDPPPADPAPVDPDLDATACCAEAVEALQRGEWDRAKTLFAQALSDSTAAKEEHVHALRGVAESSMAQIQEQARTGDVAEALTSLKVLKSFLDERIRIYGREAKDALAFQTESGFARMYLGEVHTEFARWLALSGQNAAAEDHLGPAADSFEFAYPSLDHDGANYAEFLIRRGALHRLQGRWKEYFEDLARTTKTNNTEVPAHAWVAHARSARHIAESWWVQGDLAQARTWTERAVDVAKRGVSWCEETFTQEQWLAMVRILFVAGAVQEPDTDALPLFGLARFWTQKATEAQRERACDPRIAKADLLEAQAVVGYLAGRADAKRNKSDEATKKLTAALKQADEALALRIEAASAVCPLPGKYTHQVRAALLRTLGQGAQAIAASKEAAAADRRNPD